MGEIASQITSVSSVYSTVCSGVDQRKHQISVSLAFVRGIHRWPINSPHKGPGPCITNVFATRRENFNQWHPSFQRKLRSHWLKFLRKMFPFDDVIMAHDFCFAGFWCSHVPFDLPISFGVTLRAMWQSYNCPIAAVLKKYGQIYHISQPKIDDTSTGKKSTVYVKPYVYFVLRDYMKLFLLCSEYPLGRDIGCNLWVQKNLCSFNAW